MALSDILNAFGYYWGVIRQSVTGYATTSQLWAAIATFEDEQGVTRPGGIFQAVSAMRSLAVTQREAMNALAKAGGDVALDASMIAQDINSRPVTEQSLSPIYNIRFNATLVTDQGDTTQWLTIVNRGVLPATKQDLLGLIDESGFDMSTSYGGIYTGTTGEIQITAV